MILAFGVMKMKKNKFSFSLNQLKALSLKKQNMLVSAGAGSGKTAVLIERLYRLYTLEKIPVSEVLVLVFGRLAAEELKERIAEKLNETEKYRYLIPEVEVANIVTFDAYALEIVKKYGANFGIARTVNNLDEVTLKVKFNEYFTTILEAYYEKPTPLFTKFMAKHHARTNYSLFNFLIDFHYEVSLKLDEEAYLKNYIATFYTEEKFNEYLNAFLRQGKALLAEVITTAKKLGDEVYAAKYAPFTESYSTITTFDSLSLFCATLKKPVKTKNFDERFPENIEDEERLVTLIDELKKHYVFPLSETLYEDFLNEKDYATFIVEFYQAIRNKLAAFKNEHNAYTFSDISKLAYKIVQDPLVKKELQKSFAYILIDEYQDTSDIQEAFIQTISANNVYMVGDIKQSIYGFRNANPELFKAKYSRYQQEEGGELVVLNDNYRSRAEVINPINKILSEVMTEAFGGARYEAEHQINAANTVYAADPVQEQRFKYKTHIIPFEEKTLKYEAEVMIVINDIKEKLQAGYEIYDFKQDKMRKANYGDFTILLRDATRFDDIEKLFLFAGVPIFPHKDETIHDDQIMLALRSALIIYVSYRHEEKPTHSKFRHAVASFLRSFIVSYSDEKLYNLFKAKETFHLDPNLSKFQEIVRKTKGVPVSQIINEIVDVFAVYEKIFTLGDVYLNNSKLTAALNTLQTFSDYRYTLTEIIDYFDYLIAINSSLEIKRTKLASEAVNMLTMHGSKGLEYPIVYYFMLDKNPGGQTSSFRATSNHGLIFPTPYSYSLADKLAKDALQSKERSEMIRLLYVALTRAKEEITIISAQKEKKDGSIKLAPALSEAKNMWDVLNNSPYFKSLEQSVRLPSLTKEVVASNESTTDERILIEPFTYNFTREAVKKDVAPTSGFFEKGTLFHRYLELVNLETKDLSFIVDIKERQVIERIINLDLFKAATNSNTYREYNYLTSGGEEKIIDLFIKHRDHITLIDFKLRDLSRPEYALQLLAYKAYLEEEFNLPVTPYLISIVTGEVKRVE